MHLKVQKRGDRAYLSVVQNYRQGAKVKSRTVETLGYADAYADLYDDPIEHFRCYVDELNRKDDAKRKQVELSFAAFDTIEPQAVPTARLGASIALGCLDALGIRSVFQTESALMKASADVRSASGANDGSIGVMSPGDHSATTSTTARRVFEMLATERMMHATSKRESWTARASFPRRCEFSFEDVYAALPTFAGKARELDQRILHQWKIIGGEPDTDRIFLVCGSYAFPVDGGSVRASIAVAIDRERMPLGYHVMNGRLGPQAFREASRNLKNRLGASRAVITAGGLRDLGPTIDELASTGDGFVLYQRDYETIPDLAEWAQDETGFAPMGGNVFLKQRVSQRQLANGQSLPVKEIMLRGGGYATRYNHAVLVSSELDLSAAEAVQLYRELWRQAEPFQPLEADFSSVPFPTAARDHILAHFAICYAGFFALRLLRWKMGWRYNAADTADALLRMEGVYLQRNYYLFNYRNDVTDHIEESAEIPLARRLRTRSELRSVPKAMRESLRRPRATA